MSAPTELSAREMVLHHLRTNYRPCENYVDADVRISTHELYEKLRPMFVMNDLSEQDLFGLLVSEGFSYSDAGDFNVEWMMLRCLPIDA